MRSRSLLESLGVDALVRGSKIKIGKRVRIQGMPAILGGVAVVIAAAGVVRFVERAAPMLPEGLRELRELWKTVRGERPELNP
jgi:hypothetical protein